MTEKEQLQHLGEQVYDLTLICIGLTSEVNDLKVALKLLEPEDETGLRTMSVLSETIN